jgi:hypothetical protein
VNNESRLEHEIGLSSAIVVVVVVVVISEELDECRNTDLGLV